MLDFIYEVWSRLPFWKTAIIIAFALVGALMQKEASMMQRVLTFTVGVLAAYVFTDPLLKLIDLETELGNATAAVLALSGRNIAAYVLRASRDPVAALQEIMRIVGGRYK